MDALKLDLQNNCIPELGEGSQPPNPSRNCSLLRGREGGAAASLLRSTSWPRSPLSKRDGTVLLFSSKEWLHGFCCCCVALLFTLNFPCTLSSLLFRLLVVNRKSYLFPSSLQLCFIYLCNGILPLLRLSKTKLFFIGPYSPHLLNFQQSSSFTLAWK